MEYKKRIEFAQRSIKIYKNCEKEYEFTSAAGVLLNIFSAVCPESDFLIDIEINSIDELPGLVSISNSSVKSFLLNLRHGLAHKTEENFMNYLRDDNIAELQITSRIGIISRFTIDDLNKIIKWFDNRIKESLNENIDNE